MEKGGEKRGVEGCGFVDNVAPTWINDIEWVIPGPHTRRRARPPHFTFTAIVTLGLGEETSAKLSYAEHWVSKKTMGAFTRL